MRIFFTKKKTIYNFPSLFGHIESIIINKIEILPIYDYYGLKFKIAKGIYYKYCPDLYLSILERNII